MKQDLHIRFNPRNRRHQQVSAYLEPVKAKYRTALIVAAVEEYMRLHPYGADYRELEEIRKGSYHSFQPKSPIRENLQKKERLREAPAPAVPVAQPVPPGPSSDTLDQVIDLYALDDEE